MQALISYFLVEESVHGVLMKIVKAARNVDIAVRFLLEQMTESGRICLQWFSDIIILIIIIVLATLFLLLSKATDIV